MTQLIIDLPANIGAAEARALINAVERITAVMSHGAAKGYQGQFVADGYDDQVHHLEDHLRRRGKVDPDSGLPDSWHMLTRAVLMVELEAPKV